MKKYRTVCALLFAAALACFPGCGRQQALPLPSPDAEISVTAVPTPAAAASAQEAPLGDLPPMVMVGGVLYFDTGRESSITARCGMMDGQITSGVDASETPTQDDQSNFGTGYGYQYGVEGTLEVSIDGKWFVFAQRGEPAP